MGHCLASQRDLVRSGWCPFQNETTIMFHKLLLLKYNFPVLSLCTSAIRVTTLCDTVERRVLPLTLSVSQTGREEELRPCLFSSSTDTSTIEQNIFISVLIQYIYRRDDSNVDSIRLAGRLVTAGLYSFCHPYEELSKQGLHQHKKADCAPGVGTKR